ncbi:MAG: sensor histidine kinase [Chloroflexi bacterium]|nr:sensor histidine kinase [Chloroflexota bacterium]
MIGRIFPRKGSFLLMLTAYLTAVSVAILTLNIARPGQQRWLGGLLLLAFIVLLRFLPARESPLWPSTVHLAAQTALVAALMAVIPNAVSALPILLFLLSAITVLAFPRRLAVLWLLLFTAITYAFFAHIWGWYEGGLTLLPYAGGYLFFGVFGDAMGRAETARQESERLLAELQEMHRQLLAYAARIEVLAVAEERNRLAREVHDTLGHRLTVAAVQLEGAQRLIFQEPQRAARMVGTVREQVREALAELRRTVATLRQPLASDLPLPQALTDLTTSFAEATGLDVQFSLPETWSPLPSQQRLACYRAAQEALTNVQRHARAQTVRLQLERSSGYISLQVVDDGIGIRPEAAGNGFGLAGLQERAAHLGGSLRVERQKQGGTILYFRVPEEC